MKVCDPNTSEPYDKTRQTSHVKKETLIHCSYTDVAKRHDIEGNLFEIITSDEIHYYLQAATAEERNDWIRAVQAVSKSGK